MGKLAKHYRAVRKVSEIANVRLSVQKNKVRTGQDLNQISQMLIKAISSISTNVSCTLERMD